MERGRIASEKLERAANYDNGKSRCSDATNYDG